MKKILYSLVLSITALSIVSCDYNDPNGDKFGNDPSAGWVEFANNGGTSNGVAGCGLSNEIVVPIVLKSVEVLPNVPSNPVNENGLDVYYTVTDVIGTSAGSVSGIGHIPAGSVEGAITFTFPEALASSVEFTITLTSTSKESVKIGHPDSEDIQTQTIRVNVENRDRFLGTYDVVETSAQGTFEYEVEVDRGAAANELLIKGLFFEDPNSQTRVFINNDGTLSFPAFADNFLLTNADGNTFFVQGLAGTISESCVGEIDFSFNLRFGNNGASTFGPINVAMVRQ